MKGSCFCDNLFQLNCVSFTEPHYNSEYHIPTDTRRGEKSLYHEWMTWGLLSMKQHSLFFKLINVF